MPQPVTYLKAVARRTLGEAGYLWLSRARARVRHWRRLATGVDPWLRRDRAMPVERHGDWMLSPAGLGADSVIYSLGIGRDIEFDRSVINRFGATVYAFDPTPAASAWLREQVLPAGFVPLPYGVAGHDGTAEFSTPIDPNNPSFGYRGREGSTTTGVTCEVRRLGTLMAMLGHTRIDLLKMDIEGAEYEVLVDFLDAGLPVRQLLIEFHHRKPWIDTASTATAVARLRRHGYELYHISPAGEEFGFVRGDAHQ